MKSYERTRYYDLAAALPLIGFYAWGVWRDWPMVWPALVGKYNIFRYGYVDAWFVVGVVQQILPYIFTALLIVLLVFRRLPRAKGRGMFPRFVAIAGTFTGVAFLLLPHARLSPTVSLISSVLLSVGTFLMVVTLAWLGRSFSIMPEARRLVTSGPYALVRHPLYFAEEVALLGLMLQFEQPWAVMLLLVQFGFQLLRMYFEEEVLAATFPEYGAYATRKARLIPGLY